MERECKPCPNPHYVCWCILYPTSEIERVSEIKREVCKKYGVTLRQIESRSRKREIVRARHAAICRCRDETDAKLSEIGRSFNRSHATVIYAVNTQ